MQYLSRECSICKACEVYPYGISTKFCANTLRFEELIPYWHGFFKNEKSFFPYSRCKKCSLLFCKQFFSQEQLDILYSSMPDNTATLPLSPLIKTQEGYLNILKKYQSNLNGNYFEMGPDIGLFTKSIKSSSSFDNFYLAEPNKNVWDDLKLIFSSNQKHEIQQDLKDFDLPDNSLNVAVLIHVLDHLLNPLEVLINLRKKMQKNAVLLIVTHDASSLLAKILKDKWPAYCLQHPQLYEPKSMKNLLKAAGFKCEAIKKTYNYFPFTYLINHFLWALGVRKFKLPELNALYLPLKLGNIATIARA